MSRLAASSFESVTSAAAEIHAQIKRTIRTVPSTFAAIGGDGCAAFKAVAAANAVAYLHLIVKRSIRYPAVVAAGLVLYGLLSPTAATAQQSARAVTELSVSAPATDGARHAAAAGPDRNGAKPLTSHSPWLAPVGHRQPRRVDVPQDEASAARERRQFRLERELDRKLIICRCS
jgi:hypothetical protein